MNQASRVTVRLALSMLALSGALALPGCQSTAERERTPEEREIPFPPPPDEPRYFYERSLISTADILETDDTDRLRTFLTGESVRGTGFGKPFDVVACNGRIYVSDTVSRTVLAFDVPGRRHFEIGLEGPGALRQPLGLNADGACNLYVADGSRALVNVYDADGNFLRSLGGPDDFDRLSHVAVTPDGDRVYAVDTGGVDSLAHRVRVYDGATGEHLLDIGRRGDGDGELNLARDAELGPDGLLYVVDGGNFRVQVFRPDGAFVRKFGDIGRQSGQFSRPKGIAINADGNVFVSDAAFGNFQIFDPVGRLLLFVGSRSSRPEPAKYMLPAGIDTDADGRVYMVDQFFRRVDVFRPAGLPRERGALGAWYATAAGQ